MFVVLVVLYLAAILVVFISFIGYYCDFCGSLTCDVGQRCVYSCLLVVCFCVLWVLLWCFTVMVLV